MVCITPCSVVNMDNTRIDLSIRQLRRMRRDKGMLYRAIRNVVGLSQAGMAKAMGCTKDAIVRREHTKSRYSVPELVALQQIAGMTDTEWCELLRQIAK